MPEEPLPEDILVHLTQMLRQMESQPPSLPPDDSPLGRVTRSFFQGNWEETQQELLGKTDKLRVWPHTPESPFGFDFETAARPYKRRLDEGPVVVVSEPIRGRILYRTDLFTESQPAGVPSVVAQLDPSQGFFHPNVSDMGHVCLGDIPPGPFPLKALLEYLMTILTYQNYRCFHPLNMQAARMFALEPEEAFHGLQPSEPLY